MSFPKPKNLETLSRGRPNVGSCQNYGPVLGTLNNSCRTILGTQKGTLILRTTRVNPASVSILQNPVNSLSRPSNQNTNSILISLRKLYYNKKTYS